MSFIKQFEVNIENGLTLLNTAERDNFIKDKITFFSAYKNYSSKVEHLAFIQEILDMYDYDNTYATFDTFKIACVQGFNLTNHKKKMVMYYDLVIMMGTVFLNVFDLPNNRLDHVTEGISGPIDTGNMFLKAYRELEDCKATNGRAYGATLILATLLEKDLKTRIKFLYAQEYLKAINNQVANGGLTLTHDEADLVAYLNVYYELSNSPSNAIYDSVYATTSAFYKLLEKHLIINPLDSEVRKMLLDKFTLNPFLDSKLYQAKVDPRFVRITQLLFNGDKLNLSNNLAHCNFGYINYYNLSITALLYSLYYMVSYDYFLI